MNDYLLTISPAWPSKTGRREHNNAVKSLKDIGWHKIATNTFRGQAKSAEAFESVMKNHIPHAANWRLHEVACDYPLSGGNWPR